MLCANEKLLIQSGEGKEGAQKQFIPKGGRVLIRRECLFDEVSFERILLKLYSPQADVQTDVSIINKSISFHESLHVLQSGKFL